MKPQRPHRATKDIDLLGYGSPDVRRLEAIFREVCAVPVQDDGLVFVATTVKAEPIREEAVYDGIRVTFEAKLGSAKIPETCATDDSPIKAHLLEHDPDVLLAVDDVDTSLIDAWLTRSRPRRRPTILDVCQSCGPALGEKRLSSEKRETRAILMATAKIT